MTQSRFSIEGMTCEHCEHAIQSAVSSLEGVVAVSASATDGQAIVEHDDRLVVEDVVSAVAEAGYSVRM
ncbi:MULTISPECIES: heavy-metal-associated domain-containing protein [unclassified Microbacterium]|uniref:heavy-metal-associated domain-containing protein n=1 Tax=unclassified Microbacterium TaxID=2609290 RepID=UPI00177B28F7|nr:MULTISPECIES: heavy metal-associated domain-containing protein [unclassified Microbacterium]MBD8207820.1 heavy-metal-associated domain-containing protein [Microbacterium sp. CFBP 8801]MBD8478046.1 heavy-metal-associated domain-containing protein [Microbacterium sp. CFBP 8794]MBD8508693.1 heavy-metal-associated domain-containing protein [Microbacterium sp. CFBP 8790]